MTHDPDGKPFTNYIGYVSLHKDDAEGVIDVDFVHSRDAAKDRRTLASLLLAGYFTPEDVRLLRREGEYVGTGGLGDPDNRDDSDFDTMDVLPDLTQDERRALLENIASRIAGVLPPPEEKE